MKKIFTLFLFSGLTFACFSQSQFKILGIYPDSLSVLNDCRWEKSSAKFRDLDGKAYQVFLDLDTTEMFLIFRKDRRFAKVGFK